MVEAVAIQVMATLRATGRLALKQAQAITAMQPMVTEHLGLSMIECLVMQLHLMLPTEKTAVGMAFTYLQTLPLLKTLQLVAQI
jgi:hypothetical protein